MLLSLRHNIAIADPYSKQACGITLMESVCLEDDFKVLSKYLVVADGSQVLHIFSTLQVHVRSIDLPSIALTVRSESVRNQSNWD